MASMGFNTKLAKGKEAAKEVLKHLQSRLSAALLKELVAKSLSPAEAAEVSRFLESSSNSSTGARGGGEKDFRRFDRKAVVAAHTTARTSSSAPKYHPQSHPLPSSSHAQLSPEKACCGNITPKKKLLMSAAKGSDGRKEEVEAATGQRSRRLSAGPAQRGSNEGSLC
jgi:hypothetical protein